MTYRVLVADPLSEEGLTSLKEANNIDLVIETGLKKEELLERIKDFDALLVRSQTQVTKEVFESGTRLKVVGRAGVGVDNIDLKAATTHGVIVVNAPNGNTNSAAEHTLAMLMALARNIPQAYNSLINKEWDRKAFVGVELKGKTLGVVGLGRIGIEVATRAKGQRMNVIAYDPFLTQEKADRLGVEFGTLEDVFKTSDFITVHTPLLKETRHIINKEAFDLMKDDVRVINCARGGIIDEEALYDAIKSKKVAGAAIDVFEEEPSTNNKLLTLKEVIATPHLGASTFEAQESVAIDVCHDVLTILNGGGALHPVNMPSVPRESLKKIEPYFYLAEKLGTFISKLSSEVVEELNIYYSGELSDLDVGPITRNAVKGYLKHVLGSRVNDVNAAYLATKKGITVNEHKTSSSSDGFTNLLTVEMKTKLTTRKVVGTLLNGLGARIVKVDNYSMDVIPEGHLIMIHHKDQPGAIGKVGTFLAENDINIATMQVGRSEAGGDAIMMLVVDKQLEKNKKAKILKLTGINKITAVDL